MAIILPANTLAAGGFSVDNSCRFNSGDSPQLSKSISSTSTTWTFSAWIKRAGFGNYYFLSWGASDWVGMGFGSTDYLQYYETTSGSNPVTTAKYRDPSAWYHIVVKNAAGTITFYVNGATPAGSGGTTGHALSSTTLYVGSLPGSNYTNAYMSEVCFIDGTAYSASDFGEFDTDGSPTIWKPKDVSGLTFGSDGFYLDFEDSGNLGNDKNGGTDLTETNLAATDQATDTPMNNFCTMNPLDNFYQAATFSEGNCKYTTASSPYTYGTSTIGVSSGKWYTEVKITEGAGDEGDTHNTIGIVDTLTTAATGTGTNIIGNGANQWGWHNDQQYTNNSSTTGSFGDTWHTGDILGQYVDLDNNKLYWSKNGALQNTTGFALNGSATFFFAVGDRHGGDTGTYDLNFGGCPAFAISSGNADDNGYGNFEYSPNITGDSVAKKFYALCTKNLAEYG